MLRQIKTHQDNSPNIILLALLSCRGITMCKQLNNFTDKWHKKKEKTHFWPDWKLKRTLKTYQVEKTNSGSVKYYKIINTVAVTWSFMKEKKKAHFVLAACALWPGNAWVSHSNRQQRFYAPLKKDMYLLMIKLRSTRVQIFSD